LAGASRRAQQAEDRNGNNKQGGDVTTYYNAPIREPAFLLVPSCIWPVVGGSQARKHNVFCDVTNTGGIALVLS
jgi:hypothetical protein